MPTTALKNNVSDGVGIARLYCAEQCSEITVESIALRLGRICRFAGGTEPFWPVLLHSLVVAELAPREVAVHALLHDVAEVLVGDVPAPVKTRENAAIEDVCRRHIYRLLGVPFPTNEEEIAVKKADWHALKGEVWTVAPRHLRKSAEFSARDYAAEAVINEILKAYDLDDVLTPQGLYVRMFAEKVLASR